MQGLHTAATGAAPGVLGETNSRAASAAGVVGRVNPTNPGASSGVWGINNGTGPSGVGVWGSHAGGGYGVLATSVSGLGLVATGSTGVRATGETTGVEAIAAEGTLVGTGLMARASMNPNDLAFGVSSEAGYCGVRAAASDSGGIGVDASGQYGVYTTSDILGVAIYAESPGTAGYFDGNVTIAGTLAKSAGSFRIDHPLAPEERWLSHSFVESPDMMNVYNGNTVLGADGTARVTLPDYFTALNRDYRYQLTCIGGHAPVYIAAEVRDNAFRIAGGTAGLKVSWQVTGIRQDDYAREHPIVVDQPKTGAARGARVFVPSGSSAPAYRPAPKRQPAPTAP